MVIAMISMMCNILIIASVAVAKTRNLAMMTKVSLAAADLGFSTIQFTVKLLSLLDLSSDGSRCLMAFTGLLQLFTCVCFYNVMLMALQRLYAIKYPFKYTRITKKKQWRFIKACWLISVPGLIVFYLIHYYYFKIWKPNQLQIAISTLSVYNVTIPFTFTMVSTVTMCVVYQWNRKMLVRKLSKSQNTQCSKLVVVTSAIASGYIIPNGPIVVLAFIHHLNSPFVVLFMMLEIVYNLNGALNFTVYYLFDEQFSEFINSFQSKLFRKNRQRLGLQSNFSSVSYL